MAITKKLAFDLKSVIQFSKSVILFLLFDRVRLNPPVKHCFRGDFAGPNILARVFE